MFSFSVDYFYDEFATRIPSEITANETNIPADVMAQLRLVKQYVGYFRGVYFGLIAFMALLIAGIFLIHRNMQDPSRALGIDLALYGVLDLAGVIVARNFFPTAYEMDIPDSLYALVSSVFRDITGIMLTFSIVVLAVGVALIIIFFVFKKRAAES